MELKVIDFHTHPYLSEAESTGMYKEAFYLSREEVKEDLMTAGIHRICGSVIQNNGYHENKGFEHIRELNRKALRLQDEYQGFYIPGFHIHPGFVRESLEEMDLMHQKEIKLIGELVPYMHGWENMGFDYSSRELCEIIDLADNYNMIISFHTMPEQGAEIEKMIAAHPKVIFVAAHPGQKADYLMHIDRMKKYENVYLDLSGTGLFRYGMLVYGVQKVGADRFLFGTDYPICNPRMYVQAVMQEHISESEKEAILYRNAERLFNKL